MSAIAGLLRLDQKDVCGKDLKRMVAALMSHGPDKQRIWSHQGLGLIHCLMRFTPEDYFDDQPIIDKQNGIAIVFSGRIDNREQLAKKLSISTVALKTMNDAQLVLEAYLIWKDKAFSQIIGDWVLAVWLRTELQLFLVRDPHGYYRSLHYSLQSDFFAFSSMPKGIMALPQMTREMDEGALADFLILNHKNFASTMYKGVERLEPGHVLTFELTSRKLTKRRYWQYDLQKRIYYKNDQDYVDHFNQIFNQVVETQLRSCHPIGAFMSGGIDSSAVATTAAKLMATNDKTLSTYTAVPQKDFNGKAPWGRYNDETPLVNDIARMNGNLNTHFIASEGQNQLSELENHLEQGESPFRNPCNRVWMENIMRTAATNGERVLFTGQYGNFTMSYDGSWALAKWFKHFHWLKLFWGIKQYRSYRERDLKFIVKSKLVKPLLAPWLYRKLVDSFSKRRAGWSNNSLISSEFAEQMQVVSRAAADGFDPYWQMPICSRQARKHTLAGLNYMGDMHESWRAAFGVELRDPTADRRIVEYCLAIPDEQYLHRKGLRWLATRAFADRLPQSVLHNQLRGAQDPGWYLRMQQTKTELELEYQRLVQNSTAQQVLDLPRMRKLLDEWPDDSTDWNSKEILGKYRQGLSRAFMVGRYIRWFEGDNR